MIVEEKKYNKEVQKLVQNFEKARNEKKQYLEIIILIYALSLKSFI